MTSYLLPIADRVPLMWILRERKTAFPSYRHRDAARLEKGDRLLLYTTRGCFRNPPRDRGRVIGIAKVERGAQALAESVRFGSREFPIGVDIQLETLVARDDGVMLAPLVPELPRTFPNPAAWSATMRRALVPIDDEEADWIVKTLGGHAPTRDLIETYTN
jgi:hypothetical protein